MSRSSPGAPSSRTPGSAIQAGIHFLADSVPADVVAPERERHREGWDLRKPIISLKNR